ncbi:MULTISPECIES: cytochrome c [Aquincola]|uniref:c-type cytochrome n=1 Tax=Aquincola TaxID=391952 RepID=UPI00061511E1|nr:MULTISPECIES: cytochrome c [Aquincola]MCR5866321.1 cytochrome c [Aquincola sp. J276]
MKKTLPTVLATLMTAVAFPAAAQFQKTEDTIEYRQGAFFVMGQHFGRIGAMANGKAPFDAKAAADNAEIVNTLAKLPWAAFGEGTDKGHNTKAKPEVWKEQDKFKSAAAKMQDETGKLLVAAKTGDLAQLKTAFGSTAQTCKACHDDFRAK